MYERIRGATGCFGTAPGEKSELETRNCEASCAGSCLKNMTRRRLTISPSLTMAVLNFCSGGSWTRTSRRLSWSLWSSAQMLSTQNWTERISGILAHLVVGSSMSTSVGLSVVVPVRRCLPHQQMHASQNLAIFQEFQGRPTTS